MSIYLSFKFALSLATFILTDSFYFPKSKFNDIRFDISMNDDANKFPPEGNKFKSSRRKVGPTQKRKFHSDDELLSGFGRVSVYCVGSAINLTELCTHVFRRSFGNDVKNLLPGERPELVMARATSKVAEDLDDEVLHVSNAPLFMSTNDTYTKISVSDWSNQLQVWDESRLPLDEESANGLEQVWKTRESLLMATQDIFYFDYGCVVFWGLTPREEKAAMAELAAFTVEPVSPSELRDSFDKMEFTFDRKANPQRPIRFDRMRLRSLQVEEKLALSYAMAQSSKLFVFEAKVLQSLEQTRYLPKELAVKGKIRSGKRELNQLIGQLFVQQTEVNLFSTILDTPDFLWDDDEYLPAYQYTRSYLEVDARVNLLNSRLGVIRDLLDVLTAQVADSNSSRLEWIVIWLISVEIIMGIISNPLFAGKKIITAGLVPLSILAYKKIDWSVIDFD